MKRFFLPVFLTSTLLGLLQLTSGTTFAQQQTAATVKPSASSKAVDVEKIIRAFTAKETEFRQALTQYGFKRDAVIQTVGMGGQISGEYHRVSRFVMDDSGKRFEKILLFPMPTLTEVQVTAADLEDLGGVQPFALEASKAHLYDFKYVGKERIDELDLYVFDVSPKVMPDPKKTKERFFQGRIWVDDQDLQIVKARGKGVPEGKERFPTFETYREQIGGRYWFPTFTFADDELVFDSGQAVRMRMRVKYTDFEKLTGKVRILEEGEPGIEDPENKPAPSSAQTTKPAKP
ncbi:MAG TPA: hypothetical protein VM866_12470 [Pyrinomonadaceae bacterium]|nr:hypothetical protein [Pyrinomonadaceae bacterium]